MRKLVKGGLFMGKLTLVLLVLGMVALPVMAQDVPRVEVFGGFQYDRAHGANLKGWDGAITANLNHWFGLTGDFSGTYLSGGHEYKYLAGPVVSVGKRGPVSPFVHVLFGGVRDTGEGSINGFAIAAGGGLDIKASRHVAVRIAQVDWLMERFAGVWTHDNVRFSAGLVFRF